jgi:IS605 OrfB family transposase
VEAAERGGAVLIIKVDSHGGYLDAAFTIGDRLYDAKTPVVAYVENKALSAGTLVLLPADLIVAKQGAVIGAMQPVAVNPVTGEITFLNESKIVEPVLRKAEVYAERAGRNVSLIREFVVKARAVKAETALKYRVVDRVVSGFDELLEILRDYNLTRLNATHRLEISRGGVRGFACSLRSRLLSVLSNPYLANALISIGALATIFALVSGRLTVLPLTIALVLLGLVGTGLNPNIVSAFLVVLGATLLAVELFILPGFGVVGISGIVLLTLVVAVDVNENNVTIALFKGGVLSDVYRVETGLGRIVIAYSERRKRITQGKSTKTREVKKKLKKLREGERKLDVLRKTAKLIESLAIENRAVVVVGNIDEKAKERMEEDASSKLRHRIHQWSVKKLIDLLDEKPIHVVKISEKGTSSRDPFTGLVINEYRPLVIRSAVKGLKRVKVMKTVLRVAKIGGRALERDVVGAVNIGLKYLNTDGSPVALGSTGTHEVWVKLVNPHRGATPLTELQVFTDTIKHR